MRYALLFVFLASCQVDRDRTIKMHKGRWGLSVKRNHGSGNIETLVTGQFTIERELGDGDDAFYTKNFSMLIEAKETHDGLIELELGQTLADGERRAYFRVFPGCCASDGNLWQEFMGKGYLHNSASIDGAADGSGFDGDTLAVSWLGP